MAKKEDVLKNEVAEEQVQEQEEVQIEEEKDDFLEDGEVELFPNGPKLNEVEEWKSRYKNVYLTEFDDDNIFVWRALTRREYKDIMKVESDEFYKEERICETCILWPRDYNFVDMSNGKAGVPSYIAEQVLAESGFLAATKALRL